MDDAALLHRFCQHNDQRAFAALVERYLGMVHGVVLRRTGSPELSEELTQNVFAILGRKAPQLDPNVVLSGWLHRAAVFESARAMRRESNRQQTMKAYSKLSADETVDPEIWNDTLPILDGAIDQLDPDDREVVFMRFMDEATLKDIGRLTGKSESAAQRHVQRALEKLSDLLRKRGVSSSAAALALSLTPELARSAPAGLTAATVSNLALSSTATTATLIMTKSTSLIIVGTLLAIAATTGGVLLGKRDARIAAFAEPTSSASTGVSSGARDSTGTSFSSQHSERASSRVQSLMKRLVHLSASGELSEVYEDMKKLARDLKESDMKSALSYLQDARDGQANLAHVLFERWGELDGSAASASMNDLAQELRRPAAIGLSQSWSKASPGSAFEWYLTEKSTGAIGQIALQTVARNLFGGSLQADPKVALSQFEALDFDPQKAAISAVLPYAKDVERAESVANVVSEISDEQFQLSVVKKFGGDWVRHAEANTVMNWFDSMEFSNPTQAFDSAIEISEAFLSREPATGLNWLWPKASEKEKEDLLEFVVGFWMLQDREAAEAWLEKHEIDSSSARKP